MKKLSLVSFFILFIILFAFSEPENQKEIDYLLFLPNSGSLFVDETQAAIQLDNLAKYLLDKDLTSGQIYVFGYTAFAANDMDSVDLSRERALFVINELQRRGVSRNLFSEPVGRGSVDLWGGNTNEEDRSPNRRVRVVLEGNIVTPEAIEVSEPEIVISSVDEKEPVRQETMTKKPGAKFPLWLFILLFFLTQIAVLIFVLSMRKKSWAAKPAESVKTEPVKAEPVKIEPPKAEPVKTESVKAELVKVEPAAAPVIITKTTVKLDEEIRQRAYELYLERGSQHGNMAGDWYSALSEVCAKYKSAGYRIDFEGEHWWAS